MQSFKDAALFYASLGWPVIPIHSVNEYTGGCSCGSVEKGHGVGKAPYTEHNHKDASKDPIQIEYWWKQFPDANVAIATGYKSNIVVVDVDRKNSGFESLAAIERRMGSLPQTVSAKSGGGGLHLYFKHPGEELRGRRGMRPGIDVMADGGRIIAPPSRHKSGNTYAWENSPLDYAIAELPYWLLRMIKTPNPKRKRIPRLRAWY